ncbi:hypothetical protein KOY_01633 [Bacillus cereus VDM021]|nr:hypothetical protein IIW_03820 [Bacillus cereus VD136]EOP77372.1 hypothetical protein KOW_03067 [Bacillus cereus VDM006]EOQ19334.1 hypothetical protein KOY_01633 [Bacillus cereus VDM021]
MDMKENKEAGTIPTSLFFINGIIFYAIVTF